MPNQSLECTAKARECETHGSCGVTILDAGFVETKQKKASCWTAAKLNAVGSARKIIMK